MQVFLVTQVLILLVTTFCMAPYTPDFIMIMNWWSNHFASMITKCLWIVRLHISMDGDIENELTSSTMWGLPWVSQNLLNMDGFWVKRFSNWKWIWSESKVYTEAPMARELMIFLPSMRYPSNNQMPLCSSNDMVTNVCTISTPALTLYRPLCNECKISTWP